MGKAGKRFGKVWTAIGQIWLVKDLAVAVGLPAIGAAVMAPLILRALTPLSFVDTFVVAIVAGCVIGLLAILLTIRFAPKIKHIHHLPIVAETHPLASLTMDVHRADPDLGRIANEISRPQLRLIVQGANIFQLDQKPTWTGIMVHARIWNTGAPSVVTEWSMAIIPNGAPAVAAQFTKFPVELVVSGAAGSRKFTQTDSLDMKTDATLVNDVPVSGSLFFIVEMPKEVVQAMNTTWIISAKDIHQQETSVTQLVGAWLANV